MNYIHCGSILEINSPKWNGFYGFKSLRNHSFFDDRFRLGKILLV